MGCPPSPNKDSTVARTISRYRRQRDGAQYARISAQHWRHDVFADALQNLRRLDVAVEQCQHIRPNTLEQVRLPHDAAAQNYPLWREGADPGGQSQGDVVGLQVPCGMPGRKSFAAPAPARLQ